MVTMTTMNSTSTSDSAQDSATQLIHKLTSDDQQDVGFVGSLELFQIGRVLASLRHPHPTEYANVQRACQQLLDSLPYNSDDNNKDFIHTVFCDIIQGLHYVIATLGLESSEVTEGLQATTELLQVLLPIRTKTSHSLIQTLEEMEQLIAIMTMVYSSANSLTVLELLAAVLPLLSLEDLIQLTQQIQDHHATIWNDFLTVKISWDWKTVVLDSMEGDAVQKEYLQSLLFPVKEAPPRLLRVEAQPQQPTGVSRKNHPSNNNRAAADELQRRIDQVCQIFPDLGQGFVEAMLGHFKGDVEQTVATLAEDRIPPTLDHLDRSLPRMLKNAAVAAGIHNNEDDNDDDSEDRAQAIAATKAAIQAAEQSAALESMAVFAVMRDNENDNLYNDDYDDQWDMDHEYDAPEVGLYDNTNDDTEMDYKNVLLYNKALKQVETEDRFWQENANTNLNTKKEGEQTFRGPDKLRGGRIPGQGGGRGRGGRGATTGSQPQKVAGAPSQTKSSSTETKTVQGDSKSFNKRRKENQMAKRKDKQKQAMAKRSGA